MEMEINVISNKNFTTFYLKKFHIYHILVESKPHERIGLLITASMNIYQRKK